MTANFLFSQENLEACQPLSSPTSVLTNFESLTLACAALVDKRENAESENLYGNLSLQLANSKCV